MNLRGLRQGRTIIGCELSNSLAGQLMLNGRAALRENSVKTSSGPPYKVKRVDTVVKGSDVQARVFTLAPGEVIPWHYHRETTDHYSYLKGSSRSPLANVM